MKIVYVRNDAYLEQTDQAGVEMVNEKGDLVTFFPYVGGNIKGLVRKLEELQNLGITIKFLHK